MFWFFAWGTKRQKQQLAPGYFNCPLCGSRQPAHCTRVASVQHINFVPAGEVEGLAQEIYICDTCGRQFVNDGRHGYDFGPHAEGQQWNCFKCSNPVPYELIDCPHCGFRFTV